MTASRAPGDKVLERPALIDRFGPGRDGRVVFTNGCFDLLHRGHVEYLFAARALGDSLVVGINSDASVGRLKGAGRPVVAGADRAMVVAALSCVDAVSLFDEDTPLDLIRALRPNVLVKGGDYAVADVVGRDVVEEAGGEIVILPFIQGRSTSKLIQSIRELADE